MENQTLGYMNHLREQRTNKHLTQQELADMVGVSRKTIWNIERGQQPPSLDTAYRIAKSLEVDIYTIFTPESQKHRLYAYYQAMLG